MDLEVQDFQAALGVGSLLKMSDGGESLKDSREGEAWRRGAGLWSTPNSAVTQVCFDSWQNSWRS